MNSLKSRQALASLVSGLIILITAVRPVTCVPKIITFAGGGPDNVPALLANLQKPIGIASGHFGTYYVSAGNRVYEINKNNNQPTIRAIAGTGFAGYGGDGGPALQATLDHPEGLALDGNSLYIAEPNSAVVRKLNLSTRIIDTFAGKNGSFGLPDPNLPANQTSLMRPLSVAVDLRHIVYIGDGTANRVYAVNQNQNISLFAGRGTPDVPGTGGIGDGGDPKAAGLSVIGVAVTGMVLTTVYISDPINKRIRVVSSNKINTYAGGSAGPCGFPPPAIPIPADSICLSNPAGIVATSSNELFIADNVLQNIWKVNSNRTGFVADKTPGTPTTIAINPNGEILFVSNGDNKVYSLDPASFVKTPVAGNGLETFNTATKPLTAVSFLTPTDLVYAAGTLYVADGGNYIVRRIDLAAESIDDVVGDRTKVGPNSVGPVTGLAVDGLGNLYLAASTDHVVFRVPQPGVLIPFAGKRNTPDNHSVFNGYAPFGLLTSPWGIAVDRDNNLLIAEAGDRVIRKVFYADGRMEFASGFFNTNFYVQPRGVAFPPIVDPAAPDNRIFVNDGNQIKFFFGVEAPTVFAGRGSAGFSGNGGLARNAEFNEINAMVFDGRGGILLSDTNNNQVRRIDLATNRVDVFAGTGVRGFSGDGGDPKNAQLDHPLGLAVDKDGNVYISDSGNNRIRKVSP